MFVSWCALFQNAQAQDSLRLNAVAEDAASDLKLRFAWGGGAAQKWQGNITIQNGSFTSSRVLSIASDAPSTAVLRDGELKINHRIATNYGGVDAAIRVTGETTVEIELKDDSGETFERTWTLEQLTDGINTSIDSQQNRLSISRTPGDKIRVRINRPHLVFEPGEAWQFETMLQRCNFDSQKLAAKFIWREPNVELPVSGTPIEFETDAEGSSSLQTAQITVPQTEGVHNLWIEVEPMNAKPAFGQFRKPKPLARCVQIVVVAPSRDPDEPSEPWKAYRTIAPQELRGSFRNGWPAPFRTSKEPREPIRKGEISVVETDQSEPALQMSPNASLTIPVYRLESVSAKSPIRVSLRYRSIPGTKLGVNYLSATEQVLHGQDSGVSVADSETSEQWLTHSFHVWPEKETGYLSITNDSDSNATIGSLAFEVGPSRLPESAADSTEVTLNEPPSPRRERMACLESPDFGGLFQAQRVVDPETGQALDDWGTFFDSIDRLTQHLKANAYDGAFVTIAADGGAIFPSAGLATGPRFDSGVFASSGCDPVQKDVVELMLRMFDREGLKLVPVLTLNSTLEQLETLRDTESMSFDLVSDEGQSTRFDQRLLPIYNPLDRTLQGACTTAIRRIVSRYESHSSFSGLALACRPDCCTLLPGSRHGLNDITLQRFVQSENINESSFDAESLLIEDPKNPVREAWLSWRAKQMELWYRDMANVLQSSQRSLYIMPIDLYRRQEFVSSMSPSLHRAGDFAKVMRESGLGFGPDADSTGIVVLSAEEVSPGYRLARKRTELNIKQSRSTEQYLASASDGVVFAHRGNWRAIDSDVGASARSVTRKQLYSIAGTSNRRRYIEAIRKFDSRLFVESGFSLPVGGEDQLQSLLETLRELPAKRFEDIGDASSGPVCMRQLSLDGRHFFYAVNDSPWPVEVTAWLGQKKLPQVIQASANANGQAAPLRSLAGKDVLLEQKKGRTQIRILLEPWSMFAAAAQTNSTFNPYAIESYQVTLPQGVDSQLRKRLHQLKSKLAKARSSEPSSQLLNGNFETFADPERSGWEFGNHEEADFQLDSSDYRDGRVSLSMQTSGKPVWIRSNTLDVPETGRLSVSAWLRSSSADKAPQPRISLEGTSDGSNFYRFGSVGVGEQAAPTLDGTWRRYVVHFDDLPGDLTNLRVGFDLMAIGQVSIDQVEVYDRWFDENDSVAMTQLLASADSLLQDEESIDGARRVLESYWVQFLDQHIGREPKVEEVQQARNTFELSLPPLEMPSFELPKLSPAKPKRVPLFQRFQRRE